MLDASARQLPAVRHAHSHSKSAHMMSGAAAVLLVWRRFCSKVLALW